MFENPLLPHRKLQELYKLMERCRALERKHHKLDKARGRDTAREAVLAATTIHLAPGDLLCGSAKDQTAIELAPLRRNGSIPEDVLLPAGPRLGYATAMARGLKVAGAEGVVLAFAQAGAAEEGWADAVAWSQTERLPLVLVCMDASAGGGKSAGKAAPLNWTTASAVAKRLKFPILTVDGEDAVAMYRAMQESVLRARHSIGPALIWAVLSPSASGLARASQPLARLRSYMAARKIALPR